jgi:SAM-dependent methyltransferase
MSPLTRGRSIMGVYGEVVVPRLCAWAMRNRLLRPYRERVVGAAEGRVLEVGVGAGMNFPFYRADVTEIIALEPAPRLMAMARQAAEDAHRPATFLEASAEAIPLDDRSVDTIVTTWTLCSIPGAGQALAELRRVLRPGGRLLFVEHGRSPDAGVRKWQDRLTPLWKAIAGGCHLNRPIQGLIENAGFAIDRLETAYLPGPKIMTFLYEGAAHSR